MPGVNLVSLKLTLRQRLTSRKLSGTCLGIRICEGREKGAELEKGSRKLGYCAGLTRSSEGRMALLLW